MGKDKDKDRLVGFGIFHGKGIQYRHKEERPSKEDDDIKDGPLYKLKKDDDDQQ